MTYLQALRQARNLIDCYAEKYICIALTMVGASEYKDRIAMQLNKRGDRLDSYEKWMHRNHPKLARRMTPNDYRQGRLQWIDHMIAQERNRRSK